MEESTKVPADAGSRPPLGTLPVLVYDHGQGPNNRQTALAIGDGGDGDQSLLGIHPRLHTGVVPELSDNDYHVTPHGWVLLVARGPSSPRTTRLWDPRTGESISLPAMARDLPEHSDDWKCYLTTEPTAAATTSCCHVLVLEICKPSFRYCRVGDDNGGWKTHDYNIGDRILPPPDRAPPGSLVIQQMAAVGGKLYFQTEAWKLGAVDFLSSQATAPELSFVKYPEPEFPAGCNCRRNHLVASRGELFDVYICHKEFTPEVLTVCVYRVEHLTGAAPTLCEVEDLGDRAFLLSDPNPQLLWSASKYGIKGNRVYFNHNVLQEVDGGMLCVYDLDDHTLEAVRPCPDMHELLRKPFWVLPTDQDT